MTHQKHFFSGDANACIRLAVNKCRIKEKWSLQPNIEIQSKLGLMGHKLFDSRQIQTSNVARTLGVVRSENAENERQSDSLCERESSRWYATMRISMERGTLYSSLSTFHTHRHRQTRLTYSAFIYTPRSSQVYLFRAQYVFTQKLFAIRVAPKADQMTICANVFYPCFCSLIVAPLTSSTAIASN